MAGMLESAGVLDVTSCSGHVVTFAFYPAHLILSLSSGGPVYVSLRTSTGTTSGLKFSSTSDPAVRLDALRIGMNSGSSTAAGLQTEFPLWFSAKTSAAVTGGIRYWALGL
jgi:hypothetical protein